MNKSESIKNLAVALKKAQSEMGEVTFDATNPFYKSRYASLGAVIRTSKNALINNGLSVSQQAITNEFGVGVTTLLMHESGEWIESTVTLPVVDQKNLAQEAGKTITYLRRYSLASLLNLYSDEDNDGNDPKKSKQQSEPVEQPSGDNGHKKVSRPMSPETLKKAIELKAAAYGDKPASEKQRGLMVGMLDFCLRDETKRHQFCYYITGHESSKDIPGAFVQAILDWMKITQDKDGQNIPDAMAEKEAQSVITQFLKDSGQQELI